MQYRERVKLALNYKEPDRVPIDLWGSASRIHTELYKRLAAHLELEGLGERVRQGTTTEYVDYRLSDLFDCDFRHINAGKPRQFKSYVDEDGHHIDEWGIGKKEIAGFLSISKHPLENAEIADLKNYAWPFPEDPGRIEGLGEQAKDWYENTNYAITSTTVVSGLFMELGQYLRGPANFLMDLYTNPKLAHHLIGYLTDIFERMYTYYLTPIAPYLEWVEFTEDYGMQDRPLIPREKFDEFFIEPHKRLFATVKKIAPQAKIFFHCCGSIKELIPSFIEMGADILNSLQPLAADMDSFELKREFGKELIFHGGIDIQEAMRGSKQDVIDETKKRIDAFGPGGGYILSPSNHFIDDVPVENIVTMYKTAVEYGKYPLKTS